MDKNMLISRNFSNIIKQAVHTGSKNFKELGTKTTVPNTVSEFGSKLAIIAEDKNKLEQARTLNSDEYTRLLHEKKSYEAVTMTAIKEGKWGSSFIYNGVELKYVQENPYSLEKKELQLGDMTKGKVLSVYLSSGVKFKFNRDNIDQVSNVWDLFSSEDRKKIMEAIVVDNMMQDTDQMIEETKSEIMEKTKLKEQQEKHNENEEQL
jgi:hypothetical protein